MLGNAAYSVASTSIKNVGAGKQSQEQRREEKSKGAFSQPRWYFRVNGRVYGMHFETGWEIWKLVELKFGAEVNLSSDDE
jgi:hypothetical protein